MKKFFSSKTNIIITCVIALLIIGGAVVAVALTLFKSPTQEKTLDDEIRALTKVYYEDVYYPLLNKDNRVEFLSDYTTLGIKVDLENLVRTVEGRKNVGTSKEIYKKFVNEKTKKECSKTKTKVTIYPKDPYGKKDYDVEVTLDCGFEK